MDMGDLTSRQIGNIMADGMLRAEEQLAAGDFSSLKQTASQNELAAMGKAAFHDQTGGNSGVVPSTIRNQNLGHNSKKTGLGQNTGR